MSGGESLRPGALLRRAGSFILLILAALGFLWIVLMIWRAMDWSAQSVVVAESAAPGNEAIAYLVESDSGSSMPTQSVRMERSGVSVQHARTVFLLQAGTARIELAWTGVRELTIIAPCGRFSDAANHWWDSGRETSYVIRLRFPQNCPGDGATGA